MFSISDKKLDRNQLYNLMNNKQAGGFVSFEGRVRDHNEGKEVKQLEYEAYNSMAIKQGNIIIQEAIEKFSVLEIKAIHITGLLQLEDIAVWIGVLSKHRLEAFKACQYTIDEIKHRLPIWKKEYYIDGDSGWVNCERCANH